MISDTEKHLFKKYSFPIKKVSTSKKYILKGILFIDKKNFSVWIGEKEYDQRWIGKYILPNVKLESVSPHAIEISSVEINAKSSLKNKIYIEEEIHLPIQHKNSNF
jgi:hypothetical protein